MYPLLACSSSRCRKISGYVCMLYYLFIHTQYQHHSLIPAIPTSPCTARPSTTHQLLPMYIQYFSSADDAPTTSSANVTPLLNHHHGIPADIQHTLICMAARVGGVLALLGVIAVFMWWRERRR